MSTILEVNDDGSLVIPAELLNGAKPHKRYCAETAGQDLLLRPEQRVEAPEKLPPDEWRRRWNELSELIGREWKSDKTAAEIISEMRR